MSCVYVRVWSLKKWTGAMTTAKNEVFIGLQPENFYLVVGEISPWWGEQKFGGGVYLGEMSKFLTSGETLPQSPYPPSKENPESGEWNLKKKVKRDSRLSQKKSL